MYRTVEVGAILERHQMSRELPVAAWSEGVAHKERFANVATDGLDITACRVEALIPFFTIYPTISRTLGSFRLRWLPWASWSDF
jgi:hypothetical protein